MAAGRRYPLEGVRVLDVTRTIAGLYISMVLGDLGAEVIKVEQPVAAGTASISARFETLWSTDDVDSRFIHFNRNKKSVALDLKLPQAREVFYDLVRKSDVVVDNYRPGVMKRLAIDYERLREINSRIICCSVSGFGTDGPDSQRPAYDTVAQGMSGLLSLCGEDGGPPMVSAVPIVDIGTAMYAAQGVMAALYSRSVTGEGQKVDACLLDTALAFLHYEGTHFLNSGQVLPREGSKYRGVPLAGAFPTSDGYIALFGGIGDNPWKKFCQALGREGLMSDPRFDSHINRLHHRRELNTLVEEVTRTRTSAEWLKIFTEGDVPVGPVNTLEQAFADPLVQSRDVIGTTTYQGREFKLLGTPLRFSGAPKQRHASPPDLGEHTAEVLTGLLGYSEERVAALRRDGAA